MARISRREFVKGAGLLPLAAALPPGALARALADTSSPYRFLTAHQAAVVVEGTARLIPGPTDDATELGHPGAREANVVRYIDTMLAAFTFDPPKVHAGGPFSDRAGGASDDMLSFVGLPRTRRLAWRKRIKELQAAYRAGVQELDDAAGGDFTTASPLDKDQILTQASITSLLFDHSIEGMYAVPEYGGNQGLVGWQDIKFPGDSQPRGYTAEEVGNSDGPDPIDPVIAAFVRANFERAARGVRLARWKR
ncbi:MAG: gluconate 2-dehydrogenase subunit 3 family protein [Actinomycetota bacterium]